MSHPYVTVSFYVKNEGGYVMSQSVVTKYEVYRDAEKISLEEIIWEGKEAGNPVLKAIVSIDGRTIENVTFKRDIASKAYAMPPSANDHQSQGVTILFGGIVQVILDRFADYILPPMKPLGINPLTGEKVLDLKERTNAREIEDTKQKINGNQFIWQK